MYKVGFGDCFKFEETISKSIINNTSSFECQNSISYKMLVDCGSKNAELSGFGKFDKFDKFVDFVYSDIFISPDTEQVKRYALLTHFHEDHYKGFLKLSDKLKNDEDRFDKFYVPYITWSNKKALIFVKCIFKSLVELKTILSQKGIRRNIFSPSFYYIIYMDKNDI